MGPYCRENDLIEAGYDTVNRMVIFIGDIPFRRLFTTAWGGLFPELIAALETAQCYGLIRDADVVLDSFERLQRHKETTWCSHIHGEHPDTEAEVRAIHGDLWRQGLLFPYLRECRSLNTRVCRALNALLEHEETAGMTYREMLEPMPMAPERLQIVRPILRQAIRADIVFVNPNGKCCENGECKGGLLTQNCTGNPCNSLTSDPCGIPPGISEEHAGAVGETVSV
jgi:hypothetical protein